MWLKAARGTQQLMVRHAPHKFFVPPYVGPSGWIGVYLEADSDWPEVRELVRDSYQLVAPKKLVKLLLGER